MKNKLIKYGNEENKKLLKRNYFSKNFLVIKYLKINSYLYAYMFFLFEKIITNMAIELLNF